MFGKGSNTLLAGLENWGILLGKTFTAFNFTQKRLYYSWFVEYLRQVTTSAKPIVTVSKTKNDIVTL